MVDDLARLTEAELVFPSVSADKSMTLLLRFKVAVRLEEIGWRGPFEEGFEVGEVGFFNGMAGLYSSESESVMDMIVDSLRRG